MFMFTTFKIILNILVILVLTPQQPQWNPLIRQLRSKNCFGTYKMAKIAVRRLTWTFLFMFYFFHFR